MKSKPQKKELTAPVKKAPQKKDLTAAEKKQPKLKDLPTAVKKQPKKTQTPVVEKKQPQKKEIAVAEKTQPKVIELPTAVKELPKKEITLEDLGTRYKCYKCGTKFYDLCRPEPLCPSCGVNQNDDEAKGNHKKKRRRKSSTFVRTDQTISAPVESEDLIEVVNEVDAEYSLDMDDIVLEEPGDTDDG
jgi:hypothetical protein